MQKNPIKISIAYDQQIIGDGLTALLSNEKDFRILETINNDNLKYESIGNVQPDVVIFEFARWPNHYLEFIRQFSQKFPGIKLLILSELISHNSLMELLVYINGYLLTSCSAKKVILALQEISESGKYLCPKVINEMSLSNHTNEDYDLTSREREILSLWLSKDNNEIADSLHISESTVRTHLKNIKQKSGSMNKIQMIVYACKNNILNNGFEPICPNCKFSCKKVVS